VLDSPSSSNANPLDRLALVASAGHSGSTPSKPRCGAAFALDHVLDAFLVTFDGTGRALRCAAEIVAAAKDIGLELRAGVHTGEVEVRGDDIAGLAVTIAKRVCDLAGPGQVLVTEAVRIVMVGSGIELESRGEHELKGVPGIWSLYAARGGRASV
jgi:class 3 adenylate cyclase